MSANETIPKDSEIKPIKVLIIGNSQISSNNLPQLIEDLSQQAPPNIPRIETGEAIIQGATLQKCWDAGEGEGSPRAMITSQKWDWVIIQEIFCPSSVAFKKYAGKFDDLIKENGARTLLFATANSTEFRHKSPAYEYPHSFEWLNDMQIEFGRERNIPVAAAGYAWIRYLGRTPTVEDRLDLYAEDKGHPGIKGSTIYSYLLHAHLTGYNPELLPLPEEDLHYDNGKIITKQELVKMRKVAWEQYEESTMSATETPPQDSGVSPLKVLIIGNSQISSNDLPQLLENLSQQAPKNIPRIETGEAIIQGATLQKCWDAGEGEGSPRAMIAAQKWDWVIVQEIFCPDIKSFREYAGKFDDMIKKAGSRTLLFATANISEFYWEGWKYPDTFKTLNDMQIAFGHERNIPVAAAGYAWMKYLGANPTQAKRLDLYAEDKGHPGIKGSTIYSCLLYAHLTGYNPELLPLPEEDLHYDNGKVITKQELAEMRKAAWEQYQESTGAQAGK